MFALANADGRQRWSRRVGTADVGGQAFAVTLDVLGEVVAAGCTEDPGGGFTVVKLNGADGSSFDQCPGDCSADARVDINELVLGVGVTLGAVPVDACTAVDVNGDGWVTVEELVRAVRYALNGCPS